MLNMLKHERADLTSAVQGCTLPANGRSLQLNDAHFMYYTSVAVQPDTLYTSASNSIRVCTTTNQFPQYLHC